jgi:hypothetical protein
MRNIWATESVMSSDLEKTLNNLSEQKYTIFSVVFESAVSVLVIYYSTSGQMIAAKRDPNGKSTSSHQATLTPNDGRERVEVPREVNRTRIIKGK